MKRKKRKTAWPRLTVMAYSREELAAFCRAVDTLQQAVHDLSLLMGEISEDRRQQRIEDAERRNDNYGI